MELEQAAASVGEIVWYRDRRLASLSPEPVEIVGAGAELVRVARAGNVEALGAVPALAVFAARPEELHFERDGFDDDAPDTERDPFNAP